MSEPEQTLIEVHPAMFRNNPIGFIVSVILIPVVLGIIILFVWWLQTRAETLIITNKRTVQRRGIISKRTSEVLHRDIRNIQISQGAFQRIFGTGDIGISSAGQSGIEILFQGVRDPGKLHKLVDQHRDI